MASRLHADTQEKAMSALGSLRILEDHLPIGARLIRINHNACAFRAHHRPRDPVLRVGLIEESRGYVPLGVDVYSSTRSDASDVDGSVCAAPQRRREHHANHAV